jgi:hypothetical protein
MSPAIWGRPQVGRELRLSERHCLLRQQQAALQVIGYPSPGSMLSVRVESRLRLLLFGVSGELRSISPWPRVRVYQNYSFHLEDLAATYRTGFG